jgi:hypothetical protein
VAVSALRRWRRAGVGALALAPLAWGCSAEAPDASAPPRSATVPATVGRPAPAIGELDPQRVLELAEGLGAVQRALDAGDRAALRDAAEAVREQVDWLLAGSRDYIVWKGIRAARAEVERRGGAYETHEDKELIIAHLEDAIAGLPPRPRRGAPGHELDRAMRNARLHMHGGHRPAMLQSLEVAEVRLSFSDAERRIVVALDLLGEAERELAAGRAAAGRAVLAEAAEMLVPLERVARAGPGEPVAR